MENNHEEEYHVLQKNETWELVNLPPGRKLVKWKWIFKTNFDSYGSYLKYNSILVANGFYKIQECLFLGYYEYSKWYKMINMSTKKSFIERIFHFEEEPMVA